MLNREQLDWVREQQKELEDYFFEHKTITEEEWKYMSEYVAECVELAKSLGNEVREYLYDTLEYLDRRWRREENNIL